MSHCLNFLLLTIFAHNVASSSIPETLNLTSNTTHLLNAQATCTGFIIFQSRPLYRDCTRAINDLSSNSRLAFFHEEGPKDEWYLPVTETNGTCEIQVRLSPYALAEASSWSDLKSAAMTLNEHCRIKSALRDRTGGLVKAGMHDWILIYLGVPNDREEVADG